MRWSDGLHLVAHYGYSLDIGNTVGLVPGAHTNGNSICACSLCVLEIGGISECYTERFITRRAFMMIDERKRNLPHKVLGNPPLPAFSSGQKVSS